MKSLRDLLLLGATLDVFTSTFGASVSGDAPRYYNGNKVLRITLPSKAQAPLLEELASLVKVDEWRSARPITRQKIAIYTTDIMISHQDFPTVHKFLESHNLHYSIMIEDVGAVIETQTRESLLRRAQRKASSPHALIDWNDYYRYDEISAFVCEIVANNSDIATLSIIGKSTEGRELQLVKISKPGSPANKNAVLIDGGFHAREWISPAITTYILNELLNNRKTNEKLLDLIDVYIVPIVNVDGYEHSHTSDRMWRKTRSNHGSLLGCRGVDPNRNFDFHFGGSGTSNDKCSEIYRGPAPFSEPEAAALRDVLTNATINFKSYLTLHSYGQWWLTPWSWTYELPEDYDDLMRFGEHGYQALRAVHGTSFLVGATTEILGTTAGCSDDWAKAVAGIKYANTLEVRDTGRYGFLLPANQIIPTAEETWAGIRAVLQYDFENDKPRTL